MGMPALLLACLLLASPMSAAYAGDAKTASSSRDVWLKRAQSNADAFMTGMASWYGADFHNKKTASGEGYDMYTFTAAHRTLPIGTVVRVTDKSNGKSVMVCVTDRGPYVRGRIIDLSYAAAQQINMNDRGVGKVDLEAQRLLDVTKAALYKGIEQAVAGNRIGDIGYAVQSYCEDAGFSVVREFVGHGTGRELHEDPEVPNYGHQGRGPRLVPGMTIAIEPMICQYDCKITQAKDGWTVKTKDGGLAAHFEHSIAILKDRTEIMTRSWDDPNFDPDTFSFK